MTQNNYIFNILVGISAALILELKFLDCSNYTAACPAGVKTFYIYFSKVKKLNSQNKNCCQHLDL